MKWLFFPLTLLVAAGIHLLYLYTHRDFTPRDFIYPSLFEKEVPVQNPAIALEALDQPYSYLGYGKQMTVFASVDGKYVIKFFNPRPVLKEGWFHQWKKLRRFTSWRWIYHSYIQKQRRLAKLSHRYLLGVEQLSEEAGIVYAHLGPTTVLHHTLRLRDKEGKEHLLPLEKAPFVLQKRAELALAHFDRLHREGKVEEMQGALNQLRLLFVKRAEKGFTDRIQTLHNNYGFVEGKAIQIDLGRIREDVTHSEGEEIYFRIKKQINQRYPEITI